MHCWCHRYLLCHCWRQEGQHLRLPLYYCPPHYCPAMGDGACEPGERDEGTASWLRVAPVADPLASNQQQTLVLVRLMIAATPASSCKQGNVCPSGIDHFKQSKIL